MKRLIAIAVLMLAGLMPATQVAADELKPDELVRQVTNKVLEILRADQALKQGDVSHVVELIKAEALPHFNMRRVTSLAVGKEWRQATPEQQQQLIDAFQALLVRTYANALTKYSGQTFTFQPLRMNPNDTRVQVNTQFQQSGSDPLTVSYMLEKTADGWKVFDVIVAGASLVTNYRNEFDQEIGKGGIPGLIHSLQNKNKPGAPIPEVP